MIRDLTELIQRARSKPKRRIVVAAAEDQEVLSAIHTAVKEGIVTPLLVGNKMEIEHLAHVAGVDLNHIDILDNRAGAVDSVRIAIERVRQGDADILMKGFVKTSDLLKVVLDRESGLRTEQMLSHVAFFQSPYYHKYLCDRCGHEYCPRFG